MLRCAGRPLVVGLSLWLIAGCAGRPVAPKAPAIDVAKVVDLTYSFGPDTIYWPTAESFTLKRVSYGPTAKGYFYAANNLCLAEHGGTHMDAPIHFAAGGRTLDQLPLSSFIAPAVVIDTRSQAATNRDYLLGVGDIAAWESQFGPIPAGSVVVMRSGWGVYWGDKLHYLGTDTPGDTANLHFPGFSKEAAQFLVSQRQVAAIGIDTASIDHGPSTDFQVHQVVNGAGKPALENLANVDRLPPIGATLVALPMKIAGGSGGPARVIALLP